MSDSAICATIGCLLGGVIVLFCVIYRLCNRINDLQELNDVYVERINVLVQEKNLYKEKYQKDEQIIENIKEILPF